MFSVDVLYCADLQALALIDFLRLHMSGESGSLTVDLLPIGDELNYKVLYSVKGNQGREWKTSVGIPIAHCQDYMVSYKKYVVACTLEYKSHGTNMRC